MSTGWSQVQRIRERHCCCQPFLPWLNSVWSVHKSKHCQRHNGPRVLTLWLELSLQLIKRMPLTLVPNLATKWHHLHKLQIWPPDGATCICYKFGHQMAPLTLVTNLVTRWRHLHQLQIWPPDGTTCISLHHLHCLIALNYPLGIISQHWVGIFIRQSHIS